MREKRKELVSHCIHISGTIMDMIASDPWKLVQRTFEYGFFINGLAQVQTPHLLGEISQRHNAFLAKSCCRKSCCSRSMPP